MGRGIFIPDGAQLRIPAGSLRLQVREDGTIEIPPIQLELALNVWPLWLDIAVDHASAAGEARGELVAAAVAGGDAGIEGRLQADLMGREVKAGMVAAAASAFALDNFFAMIRPYTPKGDELEDQWRKARTARHRRISEGIRRTFRVGATGARQLSESVQEIFKFRDWAVHPPAEFREAVQHDYLKTGVEWRFVAFGASNAAKLAERAAAIIGQCINAPRPANKPLVTWCEGHKARIDGRWSRARRVAGLDDV